MRKKRQSTTPVILIAGVLILIVVAAIMFYPKGAITPKVENKTLVTVNGEAIGQAEIESLFIRVPEQSRNTTNKTEILYIKEILLNQSIEQMLLLQEAKKQNIVVQDSFVNEQFALLLQQNRMDENMFDQVTREKGINPDDIRSDFKKQLTIFHLINESIISKTNITDKEIDEFVAANDLGLGNNTTITQDTREQLRNYMLNQKISMAVQIMAQQLKATANIQKVNALS